MSANADFNPLALRVAHLHARLEWDADADRLLTLMRQMHARGIFTVLVAPASGLLARRARQAGLRVIDLEAGGSGRRRLVPVLFEFHLTHLHAPDPSAASLGQRLRRRLKIPVVRIPLAAENDEALAMYACGSRMLDPSGPAPP